MENYIKIINIIDKSGSMSSMLNTAITGFNEFLDTQKGLEGDCLVSTILFDNGYHPLYEDMDIKDCYHLDRNNYIPAGCTHLYDSICITIDKEIDKLGFLSKEERPSKTLCVILTDGYENGSKKYSSVRVKEMITEMREDFNWEFIFLAANEEASFTAQSMGISSSNSYSFSNDDKGLSDAFSSINYVSTIYRTSDVISDSLMDDYRNNK